ETPLWAASLWAAGRFSVLGGGCKAVFGTHTCARVIGWTPRWSRRSLRSAQAADADDGVGADFLGSLADNAGVHLVSLPHDGSRSSPRAEWSRSMVWAALTGS